jgi:hypothetical protein
LIWYNARCSHPLCQSCGSICGIFGGLNERPSRCLPANQRPRNRPEVSTKSSTKSSRVQSRPVHFYSISISSYPLNVLPVQQDSSAFSLQYGMACKSQPHREVDVAFSVEPQTPPAKSASQGCEPFDFSRLQSHIDALHRDTLRLRQ